MSELVPYLFEGEHSVRTIVKENSIWFVALDICEVLGLKNTSKSLDRLEEAEKAEVTISYGSQKRNVLIINESGLYSLTFTSRKPEAKRFKSWVTSEVLPQIRKTGQYAIQETSSEDKAEIALLTSRLMQAQADLVELYRDKIETESRASRHAKKIARQLMSMTNFTDDEIAALLEDFFEDTIPEWVALQRRRFAQEQKLKH